MDRQYQYPFVGNSDHYDFLSHHAGQWSDPILEKGIAKLQKISKQLKAQAFIYSLIYPFSLRNRVKI